MFIIYLLLVQQSIQTGFFEQYYPLAEDILNSMTLDQKIGQTTQADYGAFFIDGVTKFDKISEHQLGSVLIGGNGCPDGHGSITDKNYHGATMENWKGIADSSMKQTVKVQHTSGVVTVKLLLGTDAVHGNQHVLGEILFPHNIGLAASHNAQHFYNSGKWNQISVKESGFNFAFAPTVAVSHNYQWGRFYETMGTNADEIREYGKQYVKAVQDIQGKYLNGALASTKHFLGDGATRNGHDEGNVTVNNFEVFWNNNIKGYNGALEENTGTIMVSYSAINNVAMSLSPLMTDRLKQELKFDGFLISDYDAIGKASYQGLPTTTIKMTKLEAYRQTLLAGMDMIMLSPANPNEIKEYFDIYKTLLTANEVPITRLNDAVKRILAVKLSMKLVDVPKALQDKYSYYPEQSEQSEQTEQSEQVDVTPKEQEYQDALNAALESLVLLQNNKKVLPLDKSKIKHIILIGERILTINGKPQLYQDFDNIGAQNGGWSVRWQGYNGNEFWKDENKDRSQASSILDALQARFPTASILKTEYTSTTDWDAIGQAREQFWNKLIELLPQFTKYNTVIINTLAESPYAEFMGDINSEYCHGTTQQNPGCLYNYHINEYLPDQQPYTLDITFDTEATKLIALVRSHAVDIPLVSVLFSGRPMIVNEVLYKSTAFIAAWLPGTTGGEAVVKSLFGEYLFRSNGKSNTLPIGWIKSMDSLEGFPEYNDTIPKLQGVLYQEGYGLSTSLTSDARQGTTVPKNKLQEWLLKYQRKQPAQDLFDEIEQFVFSKDFEEKCLPCKQILIRYNCLVMHCWLLQNTLQRFPITAFRLKRSLDALLYKYATDSVYQFEDYSDQLMRQELERNQRTIYFAMDDLFKYAFTPKPIEQLVYEDILLNQQSSDVQKVCEYIFRNKEYIDSLSLEEIKTEQIKWGI